MIYKHPKARVVPVDDLGSVDTTGYVPGEASNRVLLANVYRLVDYFGWSEEIYNHITLRVNSDDGQGGGDQFLINPYGLRYSEITASSLIRVDLEGNVLHPGTTGLGVNVAGFTLHSAIHAARQDIGCVLHVHTPTAMAVSVLPSGLLPICQHCVVLGEINYYEYKGIFVDSKEQELIVESLGPINKVLFLRNHGIVVCGETVEEAFYLLFKSMQACETMIRALPMGLDNLILITDERLVHTRKVIMARKATNKYSGGLIYDPKSNGEVQKIKEKPHFGKPPFIALLRHLRRMEAGSPPIPIYDLESVDTSGYEPGEVQSRIKLASAYRIVDRKGWTEIIFNHMSARVGFGQLPVSEHFLISPLGLLFSEVTASSLAKMDLQGRVVHPGSTDLGVHFAAFTLHSAIYKARKDLNCVIHLHTPEAMAVSAFSCGLLPICQQATIIGGISYHDYHGVLIDPEESTAEDLGPVNKVMFLRNHGLLVCGETVEETLLLTTFVMTACDTMLKALKVGRDHLILMSNEAALHSHATFYGRGINSQEVGGLTYESAPSKDTKTNFGQLEFKAAIRELDDAGYETGYEQHCG